MATWKNLIFKNRSPCYFGEQMYKDDDRLQQNFLPKINFTYLGEWVFVEILLRRGSQKVLELLF